jgi:hypothetical protein
MSREYVFWFMFIKRRSFDFNSFWNAPNKLIRVVVSEHQIWADAISGSESQDILSIDLSNISEIDWEVSSPGSIGRIRIITQDLKHYYLTPVNPLDPSLMLTWTNINELKAFCNVVNALKTNKVTDYDENPYIRQIQTKAKPTYLKNIDLLLWDKNVSPLEYYYAFVPTREEQKRQIVIKLYKIFVVVALSMMILIFLYAMIFNFK